MTVAHTFASDTVWILCGVLVMLLVFGEKRAGAVVTCVWLVCLAALYWRAT